MQTGDSDIYIYLDHSNYYATTLSNVHVFFKSPATYQMEYERRASEGGYSIEDVGGFVYDAVWAMAFALNATMSMINSQDISNTGCENASGMLVPLELFNYTNKMLECVIQFHLQNANFTGVSVSPSNNR